MIFPSRSRQRIRKWSPRDHGARKRTDSQCRGRREEKGDPSTAMHRQREMYRGEETQLTFPPRKTWYHTEVPPKSMWKSVKQPFTLIRQYLQHRSRGAGKKHFDA